MVKAFKFFKGRFSKNEEYWQSLGILDNIPNRENMINVLDVTVQYLTNNDPLNSGLSNILRSIMYELYKNKRQNYTDKKILNDILYVDILYTTNTNINNILTSRGIDFKSEEELISIIVEKSDWVEF